MEAFKNKVVSAKKPAMLALPPVEEDQQDTPSVNLRHPYPAPKWQNIGISIWSGMCIISPGLNDILLGPYQQIAL